ncbi:MAG: Gfo/Idh/MocA family oxidoreductase [Micromonospora sp.]
MTEAGKRIRIAVAGLGVIARTVHLPLLQRRSDLFDIVALSDLSPSRLAELGTRYGVEPARRYADAGAMLAAGGCDAVLLATSGSHGELAAEALRQGLPVLCEKPLAYTHAEADELTAASATGAASLMVGYMKQYDPAVAEAARLLDRIGGAAAVHAVEVTVLHAAGEQQLAFANLPPAPRDVPAAASARLRDADERLLDAAVGGDAGARTLYQILINSVSHDLSLLRLFTGAPATVDHVATWPLPDGPAEPSVEISGRLPAGGRYGIRWLNLPDCPAYRETVTLHHARGTLELVFPSPYLLNAPTTLTAVDRHDGGERRAVFRSVTEAFEQELVAFHAMVTAGVRPLTGIAEGATDVRTSQQVVRRYGELTGAAIGGEAAR